MNADESKLPDNPDHCNGYCPMGALSSGAVKKVLVSELTEDVYGRIQDRVSLRSRFKRGVAPSIAILAAFGLGIHGVISSVVENAVERRSKEINDIIGRVVKGAADMHVKLSEVDRRLGEADKGLGEVDSMMRGLNTSVVNADNTLGEVSSRLSDLEQLANKLDDLAGDPDVRSKMNLVIGAIEGLDSQSDVGRAILDYIEESAYPAVYFSARESSDVVHGAVAGVSWVPAGGGEMEAIAGIVDDDRKIVVGASGDYLVSGVIATSIPASQVDHVIIVHLSWIENGVARSAAAFGEESVMFAQVLSLEKGDSVSVSAQPLFRTEGQSGLMKVFASSRLSIMKL